VDKSKAGASYLSGPIHRPDPAQVRFFDEVSTSTLASVLDQLGLAGVMLDISPVLRPARCVGVAFTVKAEVGELGSYRAEAFALGDVVEATERGDVIVIDLGGRKVATWGGLAALAAKLRGVAGLVVDGGVRDVDELAHHGFQAFSRHVVPLSPRTRVKITEVNTAIEIGTVAVAPGDIIVGDSTGVVRVPYDAIEEVIEAARRFNANDARAFEAITKGASLGSALHAIRKAP